MILDLLGRTAGALKPSSSGDYSENENYFFGNMKVSEMDKHVVKVKLEAVRMVLESCIKNQDGYPVMDKDKKIFLMDFVNSLGWKIAGNIKFGVNMMSQANPHFTIVSTKPSATILNDLDTENLDFVQHNIMEFQFQSVRNGKDEEKWIFFMKSINEIISKPKEKA